MCKIFRAACRARCGRAASQYLESVFQKLTRSHPALVLATPHAASTHTHTHTHTLTHTFRPASRRGVRESATARTGYEVRVLGTCEWLVVRVRRGAIARAHTHTLSLTHTHTRTRSRTPGLAFWKSSAAGIFLPFFLTLCRPRLAPILVAQRGNASNPT